MAAELVALRDDKEKLIDDYLDSAEYRSLMDQHDEILFPSQFTEGWNKALEAVLRQHPGLFQPSAFPSPHLPSSLVHEPDSSEELFGEGDALVRGPAATAVLDTTLPLVQAGPADSAEDGSTTATSSEDASPAKEVSTAP